MSTKFDKAVEIVQGLPKDGAIQPSQGDKLFFYARYKQATVGNVNIGRPGLLDFVGRAKWDAWNGIKAKAKEDAEKEYVDKLVEILQGADDAKEHLEAIEAAA